MRGKWGGGSGCCFPPIKGLIRDPAALVSTKKYGQGADVVYDGT